VAKETNVWEQISPRVLNLPNGLNSPNYSLMIEIIFSLDPKVELDSITNATVNL